MRSTGALVGIAVVVCLVMNGCAGVRPEANGQQQHANLAGQKKVADAQTLAQTSKYADAIAAYRLVLKEHANSEWAAEAKYGIALAYASADNPKRDYAAAIAEFDEFLTLYPADRRAGEAKNWRQTLKLLQDTKKENDRLYKNIEKLKQLDVKQEEKRLGR